MMVNIKVETRKLVNHGSHYTMKLYQCEEGEEEVTSIIIAELLGIYESFSDVGESRVWFASKNLTGGTPLTDKIR